MRSNNRSNALLVELLIVVIFFMLAATVLLQVFTAARNQVDRAEMIADTLIDAQNVADTLYASDDPKQALSELGFQTQDEASWTLSQGDITSSVALSVEDREGGAFWRHDLTVTDGAGNVIVELPGSRYREVTP